MNRFQTISWPEILETGIALGWNHLDLIETRDAAEFVEPLCSVYTFTVKIYGRRMRKGIMSRLRLYLIRKG